MLPRRAANTLYETTTQINKKIYYDVLAFENASLNRIFTCTIHKHKHTHTHITRHGDESDGYKQTFKTGTENTGLIIIHNKVEIL